MLDEYSMNELLTDNSSNENTTTDSSITENTIQDTNVVTLETIHNDLGFICSFLVFATVVIFIIIIYKFFNMFF